MDYVESSKYKKENLIWMILAVLSLSIFTGYEIINAINGRLNLAAFAYILLFFGLLIWKYGFNYTYTLTDKNIKIVRKILWFSQSTSISFVTIENIADHYVKRLFGRTGIAKYSYYYCAGDDAPTRVLTYYKNHKKHAIVFKASNNFFCELKTQLPGKCLITKNK